MREIKFRGKRLDNGEWVHGYFVKARDNTCHIIAEFGSDITCCSDCGANDITVYEVDPSTVGQYTGLKDKNGKEVYEGDIVDMHQFLFDGNEYEHETKGAIKWGEYGWLLSQIEGEAVNKYMGYKNGEGETYFINFYGLHEESFEIIGNIHDNPELLKE